MVTEKRVALVLGAGGTLGAAWMIGGLAAVQERVGRPLADVDTIIGTSAGSVVAAALRHGSRPDDLVAHQLGAGDATVPGTDEFERDSGIRPSAPRWRLGSPRMLATAALAPHSVHPRVLASALLPEGRCEHHSVRRYVQALAGDVPDRWPRHHTWIVGVDYEAGRRIVFGRAGSPPAPLADAVVASCSIPGWHRPAVIGGRRYVDGGVRSIASVDLLCSEPYDEVYVLAPMASFETDRPRHPAIRAERMVRQLLAAELRRDVAKVERTGARVTVLTPGPADLDAIGGNLMDGRRRADVLRTAQRTIPAALTA
ncbi:patatin-like phospholipase family protein [Actinoplanes oblitus]|uniref:Patatin-like phospholipase family protein n=1 Tax=Actinoplanes oblitus TaxID=3040509 RepID=A0ABY8W7P0_9ACTN|nr:patatin-like phospholipase family protein [Actinoplanes oblitus]WIM92960.1 patatin-like phospholipase family protein [Actinoplanes oblitus]